MNQTFILYAPNVHTGGGFVLLRALLTTWPGAMPLTAFLDARARDRLVPPPGTRVCWVRASLGSRLKAEFSLCRAAGLGITVLCFHGLPPLLSNSARVLVFQQNRLNLGLDPISQFAWRTRLRLAFERIVSRVFRYHVSQYIVQTPSMQRAVLQWLAASSLKGAPIVEVIPFVDTLPANSRVANVKSQWDFVYVADGESHKNHRVLLAAWQLLAQEGLFPSLALTLSPRDEILKREVCAASELSKLHITDLGHMSHEDVLALYSNACAMIFPSTSESFGLPLVEAAHMGLPIVASELDFVRDVCVPEQTFDPTSPVSVARAVKRFLGRTEVGLKLRTPTEFWANLLQNAQL